MMSVEVGEERPRGPGLGLGQTKCRQIHEANSLENRENVFSHSLSFITQLCYL